MISNRMYHNREPKQSLKGVIRNYTECPNCGYDMVPGTTCGVCENFQAINVNILLRQVTEADMDRLHALVQQALTDPDHILSPFEEINWTEYDSPDNVDNLAADLLYGQADLEHVCIDYTKKIKQMDVLKPLFDLFKAREIAPTLPTHDAAWFTQLVAETQEKIWLIGEACIVGSKEWFDAQPEVKF